MIWLASVYILLELHSPRGQKFDVKIDEIVSLRQPSVDEHFAKGTHCLVNTSDGKFSAVSEDCDIVRGMIEQGEHK
jgi:hypothetical protein